MSIASPRLKEKGRFLLLSERLLQKGFRDAWRPVGGMHALKYAFLVEVALSQEAAPQRLPATTFVFSRG
jgi:hypothetical protein